MAEKKLSTQEILAMARKQAGSVGTPAPAPAEPPPAASEPASEPVAEAPSVEAPAPAAAKPAPKSTADILAAARAAAATKGTGGAAPGAPAGEKPKSTADILAAARAQGGASAAAPAAKPKSTADILAAARAGGKGGAAPAAKPAAEGAAPVKKAAVTAAATGDQPPISEMIAAVKKAQSGEKVAPKLPQPSKPRLPDPQKISRRKFADYVAMVAITPFAAGWSLIAGIGALWGLATARFMMPNTVLELPSRFKVGPPSDFPPGTVNEKYKASRGIWIVNTDQYNGNGLVYALASVCTHLGCTPNWLEGEQKFKCPCHGSGFYITGINFEGPAPRPLERVGLRLAEDGMLEVDKSLKFQEELGQWADAKSFVEVG